MAAHRFGGIGTVALAVATLALGACGGGSDDDRVADDLEAALDEAADEMADADTTEDTTEPEPREVEPVAVDLDLPRETTYAHATWTVTDVAFQGAGVDELGSETDPQAVVGFTVANTGEGGDDLTVSPPLLSLLDAEGRRVPAPPDALEEEIVVAGGRSDFEAVFLLDPEATEDDLADHTFQVGEEGYVPAAVPLSGAVPDPGYPITVPMPTTAVEGDMIGGHATISSLTGTVTLDYAGQRAEEGTRFLTVSGNMQGADGGRFLPVHDDLRVSVDGIEADAAYPDVDLPDDISNGGTAAGTWVFVIPADGKDGMVDFGSNSAPEVPGGPFAFPSMP
jgi:hypothetical protein